MKKANSPHKLALFTSLQVQHHWCVILNVSFLYSDPYLTMNLFCNALGNMLQNCWLVALNLSLGLEMYIEKCICSKVLLGLVK